MNDQAVFAAGGQAHALYALLRAIAARDRPTILRLLDASPALARAALRVGASRDDELTYYFEEIGHYAYAGDTALHIAAAAYLPDIAEKLVARGADASASNRRGAEPLHYAADGAPGSAWWNPDSQHAVVAFLIAVGANPNAEDRNGATPLHRAVRTRCSPAVRALLSSGADPIRRNRAGSTPLHLAVQNTGRGGTASAAARAEQAAIIRLLLSYGARPSDTTSAGKTVADCITARWIEDLFS
jgi:ankyrin repeat protein